MTASIYSLDALWLSRSRQEIFLPNVHISHNTTPNAQLKNERDAYMNRCTRAYKMGVVKTRNGGIHGI
jgi:hypothetical protein